MPVKSLKPFLFVLALITVVSLACMGGSVTPEPVVVTEAPQQPVEPAVVTVVVTAVPTQEEPTPTEENTSSGGFVTFTDRNELFSIEVPADWTYEESIDTENNYYYIDTFTSPDGGAVI